MKLALLIPGYLDSPQTEFMQTFDKKLRKIGYEVVKVDPCSLWEIGNAEKYSITNAIKTIENELQIFEGKKLNEVVLIGHSLGGLISIIVAEKNSVVTKVVALCSPARIGGSVHKWNDNGWRVSKRSLFGGSDVIKTFKVSFDFIEDGKKYSAEETVKDLDIPIMIVGVEDDVKEIHEAFEVLYKNAQHPQKIWINSIGHDFIYSNKQSSLVFERIREFVD